MTANRRGSRPAQPLAPSAVGSSALTLVAAGSRPPEEPLPVTELELLPPTLRTGTYLGAPNTTTVVTVPFVSGYDDYGPVSPELVLVDPALRAQLAERQSALHDAPLPAEEDVAPSTDVPQVPIVSGNNAAPVTPEPVLVDPRLRAHAQRRVPGRSAARRLLVVVAAAVAFSAAAGVGVFVGLLLSGDRLTTLGDAARPPSPPIAAATTAAKPVRPAVSTQPPISPARTPTAATSTARQAGTSGAPWSRLLVWAPVANAAGYTVEITRNGESVYAATTSVPRLLVPSQWRHNRRTVTLSAGTYRWYVWPVFRSGTTTRRSFAAVVASKLEIAP